MIVCRLCGVEKLFDSFYKHPSSKTGYDSKCKECAKAMIKAARERNPEHYRAFDKARANRPDRVLARKAYQKTEDGKKAVYRAHKAYQARAPERRAAHIIVGNAIRDKRLMPWPKCAIPNCECEKVEAHHSDYSRTLDVVWLCNKHHREAHKNF